MAQTRFKSEHELATGPGRARAHLHGGVAVLVTSAEAISPVASPARALRRRLNLAMPATSPPEDTNAKWPLALRAVFITASSAFLWAVIYTCVGALRD